MSTSLTLGSGAWTLKIWQFNGTAPVGAACPAITYAGMTLVGQSTFLPTNSGSGSAGFTVPLNTPIVLERGDYYVEIAAPSTRWVVGTKFSI
ncbi:MAG: hypothetical protein IPL95_07695 [Saprospiraceae bacterium]|nr:hypothetical protein [Saprospiraceae bacterium]